MSKIEWTDETWNITGGCEPCSPGCEHCAAARSAQLCVNRGNKKYEGLVKNGKWTGEVRLFPDVLEAPLHWRTPRMIFTEFMGDLFHKSVPDEFRWQVYCKMHIANQHTYQVLTKRDEEALQFYSEREILEAEHFNHIWLGFTVCNQKEADEKIPNLLKIKAMYPSITIFVSIEPMLGAVDISDYLGEYIGAETCSYGEAHRNKTCDCLFGGIDWVILGGESGPGARPMQPEWARSVRDQCHAAGVPFFFKQWGSNRFNIWPECYREQVGLAGRDWSQSKGGRLLDGKEWNQYPKGGMK